MSDFDIIDGPKVQPRVVRAEDVVHGDRPLLVTVVVRQLHSKRQFSGDGYSWSVCAECRQSWPCATEQAIANALAIPSADRESDGQP